MFLTKVWHKMVRFASRGSPPARRRRHGGLTVEFLEGRLCPSGGYLVVGSWNNNSVLRYDESSGAFVDRVDPHNSFDNLHTPVGGVFGPDGNLYVSSGIFSNSPPRVLQYNGTTGEFQRVFASQNITSLRGILFGPDGNLYVANGTNAADGDPASVERFDGQTGAFLGYFVQPGSGGLESPNYMVFGPNGADDGKLDLYVSAAHIGSILRYGSSGEYKGVFVSAASGGLSAPAGMVFGPDGSLYVASGNLFTSSNGPFYSGDAPPGDVLRYQGPSGGNPGAFQGIFVAGGTGGLANPEGLLFGPDPSGNGNMNLYVASAALHDGFHSYPGTSQVLRYDAGTGAFLGTFVASGNGLKLPTFLTFTETNPTTLNYDGAVSATNGRLASPTALVQPTSTSPSGVLTTLIPGPLVLFSNTVGNSVNLERSADPLAASDLLTISPSTGYIVPGASHATATLDHFFAEHALTPSADLLSADLLSALVSLEGKK